MWLEDSQLPRDMHNPNMNDLKWQYETDEFPPSHPRASTRYILSNEGFQIPETKAFLLMKWNIL